MSKKALYIFIDSNIFLNFYDFHHEDLERLAQLVELVEGEDIKLFTTKQIRQEVQRNRETRLAEAYDKFRESKITLDMPVICQPYSEYIEIKEIQKSLSEKKSELSKKLWSNIVSASLEADKIIKKLFDAATDINSDEILDEARTRYALGNPPGKKDGLYGDEINWEALLRFIPTDNHFVLISDDRDYKSPLSENELRVFLTKEWEEKKGSKILFYRSLTSFFKEHKINIELRWEEEKDQLIKELSESPNFSTTHEIVKRLSKFINFSEEQIRKIGTEAFANSQVSWIAKDPDVKRFYEKHVLPHTSLFSEEERMNLQSFFTDTEAEKDENDDSPF